MLRAAEMDDAARRGNHSPHHGSTPNNDRRAGAAAGAAAATATAAVVTPGRREEEAGRGNHEEKASPAGHFVGSPGTTIPEAAFNGVNGQRTILCSNGGGGIEADTDTSEHLGVIDVSKVSSKRKSERYNGAV